MPAMALPACRSVEIESGRKPSLDDRHRDSPGEASAAVADVEDDAALPALEKRRVRLARGAELAPEPGINVGVDVARPQLLREQLGKRLLRKDPAEIDHDGDAGHRARLDGSLHGRELRAGVMSRLDADDQAFVPQRHLGRRLGFHIVQVTLESHAAHAVADDVEEREDARAGAVDDPFLEIRESSASRSSRHRRRS